MVVGSLSYDFEQVWNWYICFLDSILKEMTILFSEIKIQSWYQRIYLKYNGNMLWWRINIKGIYLKNDSCHNLAKMCILQFECFFHYILPNDYISNQSNFRFRYCILNRLKECSYLIFRFISCCKSYFIRIIATHSRCFFQHVLNFNYAYFQPQIE